MPADAPSNPTADSGDPTLLLVEDDVTVLRLSARLLRGLGYRVLAASGPREALQLAEAHPGPIRLLVTDVVMPDMNGLDLWRRLEASRPGLECLFVSGYTADEVGVAGMVADSIHFLPKPYAFEVLAARIRELLT